MEASTPQPARPGQQERKFYREYLRVSKDRTGRSTDEQHTDNQQHVVRLGGELHPDPYCDLISASRYSTKVRDDFDRLIADLKAGRFAANYLMLWEASRGSRKVGEWVELIELCEASGVGFYVTTHARHYDPANGRDRRTLLEDAVDSEYESYKTSERCLRTATASALNGAPHGKTPYGYRREYDMTTGQLLVQVPDEETVPVVREIVRRLLAGEALYAVAGDLTKRGIPAPRGAASWDPIQVRRIAINPTYAGLRTHNKVVVGPAKWPALISEADHLMLKAKLTDPSRKTWRDGSVKHLLVNIAECGVCGALCRRIKNRNTPSYACAAKFCVVRVQHALDRYVTAVVLHRLALPDALELMAGPGDTQAQEAAGKVRELRARLDEFYGAAAAGEISAAGLARIEAKLLADITAAERRATPRGLPAVVSEVIGPDAAGRWEQLSMPQRRDIIRALLVPRILPAGKGTRRFDPDRVEIAWKGSS